MTPTVLYGTLDGAHLWILDDDQDVIEAARALLPDCVVIDIDSCRERWEAAAGFRLFVIDSTIHLGVRRGSDAATWLDHNEIRSDEAADAVVVLYSGSPVDGPWHRRYAKHDDPARELGVIFGQFRETVAGRLRWDAWPERLSSRGDTISRAIHALENLAVPLWIDVDTLETIAAGNRDGTVDLLRDLCGGYFGAAETPGYLRSDKVFPSQTTSIEREVARVLEPALRLRVESASDAFRPFLQGDSVDLDRLAAYLQLSPARETLAVLQGSLGQDGVRADVVETARTLRDALKPVAESMASMAKTLRATRIEDAARVGDA